MTEIFSYTDGACKKNPGPGGWGWTAKVTNEVGGVMIWEDYGGEPHTTNQKMELSAIHEILSTFSSCKKAKIYITTDSMYSMQGLVKVKEKSERVNFHKIGINKDEGEKVLKLNGWMGGWLNYKKINGNSYDDSNFERIPKNSREWWSIYTCLRKLYKNESTVYIRWVKGHSGDEGNDRADYLSNLGVPMKK